MRTLTFLALLTLCCTCVRAQNVLAEPLKFESASIAFIKNSGSLPIDSLSISTSVDKVAYGFSFLRDTLLLDVKVLLPVEELTIETFAAGRSYGKQTCWVDPPTANVYLSATENEGRVDSVGLSLVNKWYDAKVEEILTFKGLEPRKYALGRAILESGEDLIVTRFIEAYLRMPNLKPDEAYYLWQAMDVRFAPIRSHPDFKRLYEQVSIFDTYKRRWLKNLTFQDVKGRKRRLPKPTTDFFLLEIYDRSHLVSRQNHEALQESPVVDSLLNRVPMISLTNEESPALWGLYITDNKFKWLHGLHLPDRTMPSLAELAVFPHSTYLLINKRFKLIGVYPDLDSMAAGVWWYTNTR